MEIAIEKIMTNPEQPRKYFDEEELSALAKSIVENGIILPLAVEEAEDGYYILNDGERRLRAAKLAGLKTVPAAITAGLNGSGSRDRLTRALIANIQRADLSPVEEAKAYQRLIDEQGLSVNQLAIRTGIGAVRIKTKLKLLELDAEIQYQFDTGKLTTDARAVAALLSIEDREARVGLGRRLAERNASVRAVVEACARLNAHLATEQMGEDTIPALKIAERSRRLDRPAWDALAQVGRLPPWPLVEIGVRDTCDGCALRGMASETVCKDCPLPAFLVKLIGRAK